MIGGLGVLPTVVPALPQGAEPAVVLPGESEASDFALLLGALLAPAAPMPAKAPPPAPASLDAVTSMLEAPAPEAHMEPTMARTAPTRSTNETDEDLTKAEEEIDPAPTASIAAKRPLARTARPAVETSTEALEPVFASRLERVIGRMREAGYEVSVTETTRTPARQQALFAQGRAAAGPVVTWTLDSRHFEGMAADVRVEGRTTGAADRGAYALLHRFAREEGLRTLGARDPGHLELPRTANDGRASAVARTATTPGIGIAAPMAVVARVAHVATVAPIAPIARVATAGLIAFDGSARSVPALPAVPGGISSQSAPTTPASLDVAIQDATRDLVIDDAPGTAAVPTERATAAPVSGARAHRQRPAERPETRAAAAAGVAREILGDLARDPRGAESVTAGVPAFGLRSPTTGASDLPLMRTGSLAAERVFELLAARDAAPAAPISELRLAFDPVRDGLESARIAMAGRQLDAVLHTRDPMLARGLQADMGTLTRALEQRGLDVARVTVGLDAPPQARTPVPTTAAVTEAMARERDEQAQRESARDHARDTQRDHARDTQRDHARDTQRDQQHTRYFGQRLPRSY